MLKYVMLYIHIETQTLQVTVKQAKMTYREK